MKKKEDEDMLRGIDDFEPICQNTLPFEPW